MELEIREFPKEVVEKARNDWKNSVIQSRIKVLQAMDDAIRCMNDEEAIGPWFMCGVPDGAELEDYEDMASDHETYIDTVKLFAKIVKNYAEEDF